MIVLPYIRCAALADGTIEAAYSEARRVIMDKQTGEILYTSVKRGSDDWRRLVTEVRRHRAL